MITEIAKSLEGQRRIAAASARLDVSVEQLGNPLRSDLPQVKSELHAKKVASQVHLQVADFEEFGFIRGCPKCDRYWRDGTWGKRRSWRYGHSQACRDRITSVLANTVQGKIRLGIAAERLDRSAAHLAERLQQDVPHREKMPMEQPCAETVPRKSCLNHAPDPITPPGVLGGA